MFYDDGKIKVRRSVKSDADYLAPRLRKSDVEEIWKSNHKAPFEALKEGIEKSIFCCTVENGQPICIFGIYTDKLLGENATVWCLASDDLEKIGRKFVKYSREFIDMMLQYYPMLFNYVDADNEKSIKWLQMCGADMKEPAPYGVENKNFRYFSFKRR